MIANINNQHKSSRVRKYYLFSLCSLYFILCSLSCSFGGDLETWRKRAYGDVPEVPVITINSQPSATRNVTVGSISGNLTVSASVTGSATLSYQWYSNTSASNAGGTVVSNATSSSFTIPTSLTSGTYYYFAEVRATGATAVRSNVATVIVSDPVITINTHPAATTNVTVGSISGNLSVSATVTGSATLSYQWYSNTSASNTGGTVVSGATSTSFAIPPGLTAGTYYYFAEVRASGATSVRSNVATVSVIIASVSLASGIEMMWVPGGSFELGRNLGTGGGSDVTPVSTVTLTGFHMGKYQVTQEQYQAVMGSNPSYFHGGSGWEPASGEVQGRRPVERVSWYDAIVFCNRLSVADDLTPAYEIQTAADTGVWSTDTATWGTVPTSTSDSRWNAVRVVAGTTGYRLPTEAQWEYAAKGGNNSPGSYTYSGSNNVGEVAWYSFNSINRTREVGKKAPNGLGIYDMSGNVWEWCWDWWGSYTSTAKTNPTGFSSGTNRVIRGGSWYDSAEVTRSASRIDIYPNYRFYDAGFRLARP